MTKKFLVPVEALTFTGDAPITTTSVTALADLGVIRTPFSSQGQAAYNLHQFPESPLFIPTMDSGLYVASAFRTPTAFESSPDNTTWTPINTMLGKKLLAMPGNNVYYQQTTKYLRITVDLGAVYQYPCLISLRNQGGSTGLQGRILLIEKLTAAGDTTGVSAPTTYGPSATVLLQEQAVMYQALRSYDGGTQKIRVTIELTNWVAGNVVNWRSLNIYTGGFGFSVQSRYPFTWNENKTSTFQANEPATPGLIGKAFDATYTEVIQAHNSAGARVSALSSNGAVLASNVVGLGAATALGVNNNWLPYTDGSNYYGANAHIFRNLAGSLVLGTLNSALFTIGVPVDVTGQVTASVAAPTAPNHLTRKDYVDALKAGFSFVQDTMPTPTVAGQTWLNLATGSLSGTSWAAVNNGTALVWVQY